MNGLKKMTAIMKVEALDRETERNIERMAVLRVSPKHINLWIGQLEMKKKEVGELAGMMGFDEVKKEIETEKNLEKWAKRCINHFTKKAKRCCLKKYTTWCGMVEMNEL